MTDDLETGWITHNRGPQPVGLEDSTVDAVGTDGGMVKDYWPHNVVWKNVVRYRVNEAWGGWANQGIASLYNDAVRIADALPDGSTERGLMLEAMKKLELADTYVEKSRKEAA